jgi:hypothetical protein
MNCDLCGASGMTQSVLSSFKTEKVKEICGDCESDIASACKALDKIKVDLTKKITVRSEKVAHEERKRTIFWSVLGMKSELLSRVFN